MAEVTREHNAEAARILRLTHSYAIAGQPCSNADAEAYEVAFLAWVAADSGQAESAPTVASAELEADVRNLQHAIAYLVRIRPGQYEDNSMGPALSRIAAALGVKPATNEERCVCGELKSAHTPEAGCIKLFVRRGAR